MKFDETWKLLMEDVIPIKGNKKSYLTADTIIRDYYSEDILETEHLYLEDIKTIRLTVDVFYTLGRLRVENKIVTVDVDLLEEQSWSDIKFKIMYNIYKKNGFDSKVAAKEAKRFVGTVNDYSRARIKLAAIIL